MAMLLLKFYIDFIVNVNFPEVTNISKK